MSLSTYKNDGPEAIKDGRNEDCETGRLLRRLPRQQSMVEPDAFRRFTTKRKCRAEFVKFIGDPAYVKMLHAAPTARGETPAPKPQGDPSIDFNHPVMKVKTRNVTTFGTCAQFFGRDIDKLSRSSE